MADTGSITCLVFLMALVMAFSYQVEGRRDPSMGKPPMEKPLKGKPLKGRPPKGKSSKGRPPLPQTRNTCVSGDPCDAAYCARFPGADCRPTINDPCTAEFFYDPIKPIDNCYNDGECSEVCPRHYNPMCGSDGVTYGNECTFSAAKCLSKGKLRLKNKGECVEKRPIRVVS